MGKVGKNEFLLMKRVEKESFKYFRILKIFIFDFFFILKKCFIGLSYMFFFERGGGDFRFLEGS